MRRDAGRARDPMGAEAEGDEQSGVQEKARDHALSVAVADALWTGDDDAAAEQDAWDALAAKLRAMGIDPEV